MVALRQTDERTKKNGDTWEDVPPFSVLHRQWEESLRDLN